MHICNVLCIIIIFRNAIQWLDTMVTTLGEGSHFYLLNNL